MMIFYCHVCFEGKYSRFDALGDFLALNSRYEFSLYVTVATKPTMKLHSQTLNVWYMYLHLPSTKCGCKYTSTIHWMSGIGIVSCVSTCIIPTKLHDFLPFWNQIPQFTRKTSAWRLSIGWFPSDFAVFIPLGFSEWRSLVSAKDDRSILAYRPPHQGNTCILYIYYIHIYPWYISAIYYTPIHRSIRWLHATKLCAKPQNLRIWVQKTASLG